VPETYVLDCSLAAKWILPESDRVPALRLFDRYASGEVSLIAPDLLLAEFAGLLAKRRRRKQISAEQAVEAFRWMTRCAPKLYDMRPRLGRALELSLKFQMSLWDCVYVVLAMEHDCAFLTADRRLFRGRGARHPSLQLIHI
jgi:predicted nucleic acid-binding protein